MPSGPKKRKAAKKKQFKDSNSSSTTHSHHGESDGGELSPPAAQDQPNHQLLFTEGDMEKHEASLYQDRSVTVGCTEKDGDIEIDKGSKSRKSHDSSSSSSSSDEPHVFEKNVVVLETASVVESLPEKLAQKVEETSSLLDPKPLLDDDDATKIEEKLVSEFVVESALVDNGAAKLPSPEENAPSEARDDLEVSTHPMGSVSEVNGADCVNEPDKQPLIASAPQAVQTTSWKGCCGILELFSSSDR